VTVAESDAGSEVVSTMRVGMAGGMYPIPEDVREEARPLWLLRLSAELGCTALQIRMPTSAEGVDALRSEADSLDIELESSSRGVFSPLGTPPEETAVELRGDLERARALGMPVIRSGYGRLTIETSRYDKGAGPKAHITHMTACLRQAARIAEEVGVKVAIENHCDLTGRELAAILVDVDSPWIGAAADTGNGFTVFCDPNDDVEALAPYTFTTHMKDMVIEPTPVKGLIPFLPRGCRLGEGNVDIPRAVQMFAERSPHANGLHLLVESGWPTFQRDVDTAPLRQDILEHGTQYLNDLIGRKDGRKP
jgi:3-oxoisoapionate decarboxylase